MSVHQWREISLNLPLFWSHIDFTNLTSAGAAEIVTLANKAPLYLEAAFSDGPQDVQPLQSMFFHDDTMCTETLAWTLPDIDAEFPNLTDFPDVMRSARVAFSIMNEDWPTGA